MVIKLKKLTMQNFKCHENFTINFSDTVTRISGKNEEGKTTIEDAVNWVLFNKLADGTKADKIRPHDENGIDVDFVEILVELDMEADGKPLNIIKTQNQDWVTKRGETEKYFKGNTNGYIVNGTPKSESEFKKFFSEIIDEELFKFTTNANAFLKLKTEDRRKKLFELISDKTDADVIDTNPKFEELRELLESKSIDDLISESNFALRGNGKTNKGYKGEIDDIPTEINAISKLKVSVDVSDLELHKNALKEQIAEVEKQEESNEKAFEEFSKFSDEIMQLKFKQSDIERAASEELNRQKREIQKRIDEADRGFKDTFSKHSNLEMDIKRVQDSINRKDTERKQLGVEYKTLHGKGFDENTLICSMCGQELPEEKAAGYREAFEAKKSNGLAVMYDKGMKLKSEIEKHKEELATYEKQLESLKQDKIKFNSEKGKAMEELAKLPQQVDLSENQEYEALTAEIVQKETALKEMNSGADYRKQLKAKKDELKEELDSVNTQISKADNSKIEEEIENYKARHKEVVQLAANEEKKLMLYEDFKKAKIDLLTDEVNKHFSIIKWRLFEKNIQAEGYKNICEPTYKGTLYGNGLNAGHKILIEMDIINTLQKINNVSVPVFLDNAERLSSVNIPSMDSQLIVLKVSDDKLKVEGE